MRGFSAGFTISQAARVIPIGWVPAAFVPVVVLLAPGPLRARLRQTALVTIAIALIVGGTSGASMLAVLRGSLGEHWLPQARANCAGLLHVAPFALVPWAVAIVVACSAAQL